MDIYQYCSSGRYPFVQENPDYLFELEEMGALFQANFGSIIGMYGMCLKNIKNFIEK